MTPRPDANIDPIYVTRFNANLEFTRGHKGNGHDGSDVLIRQTTTSRACGSVA